MTTALKRGDRVRISAAGKRARIQWRKRGVEKVGTVKEACTFLAEVHWDGNKKAFLDQPCFY